MASGITIYTNCETANRFDRNKVSGGIIGRQEKVAFRVGGFLVAPFYVPHTTRDRESGDIIRCPNFGYLIQHRESVFLYATDFEYLPYNFKRFKIDTILIECNHDDIGEELRELPQYEHILRGHSSICTVKAVIEANKSSALRNIILCHLSEDNADEEDMARQIREIVSVRVKVSISKPGTIIEIGKAPF